MHIEEKIFAENELLKLRAEINPAVTRYFVCYFLLNLQKLYYYIESFKKYNVFKNYIDDSDTKNKEKFL